MTMDGSPMPDDAAALRGQLRDLAALLALPAMWSGRTPPEIAESLLDVVASVLRLDVAFVRLDAADGDGTVETWRPSGRAAPHQLVASLEARLGRDQAIVTATERDPFADGTLHLAGLSLGVLRRAGTVVVGSRRPDFPTEAQRFLLSVAVEQAAIAINTTRVLRREQAARAEAETARQRFHDLIESLDAIVWEADADTFQFTFVSDQAETMLGYPIEQWLSDPRFWAEHIHADDREATVAHCVACTQAGEDHAFEYRCLAADGRVVWLNDIVRVVKDAAGRARWLRGLMVDVTDRKRAEALSSGQQHVLEMVATGAALADVLATLVRVIEAQSEGMLCSVLVRDAKHERFRLGAAPTLPESYIAALANSPLSPPHLSPCAISAHCGRAVATPDIASDERWAEQWRQLAVDHGLGACYSSPIFGSDGTILGSFGVYHRKSHAPKPTNTQLHELATHLAGIAIERDRVEAELAELLTREQAARAEAEDAVRARDEFLSIASHELRNPIAAIKGSAQLLGRSLRSGRLDAERLERHTGAIDEMTNRLAALVDDLLNVARLRSGQFPLRLQPTDLAALVRGVVDGERAVANSHRLRLEGIDQPCHVVVDTDRIQQVLVNLLENAVKYSPEGGEIRVRLSHAEDDVLLRVEDEGIGLPAGMSESIFQPFGRAANATARNLPGMGLGLYICRRIAEAHDGTLSAESAGEDQGTTLLLRLPIAGPPARTAADG